MTFAAVKQYIALTLLIGGVASCIIAPFSASAQVPVGIINDIVVGTAVNQAAQTSNFPPRAGEGVDPAAYGLPSIAPPGETRVVGYFIRGGVAKIWISQGRPCGVGCVIGGSITLQTGGLINIGGQDPTYRSFVCNASSSAGTCAEERPNTEELSYAFSPEGRVSQAESAWMTANQKCFPADYNCQIGKFFGGLIGGLIGIVLYIVSGVITLVNMVLAIVLVLVGGIFGLVMENFVLKMGDYINGAGAQGVREAWTIMRDVANIGIIAGLVATAIGTILQNQNWSVNKSLARLLIAALLVNFSYFFAGAVIDAANFTTGALYRQFFAEQGIFTKFMGIVEIQGILATPPGTNPDRFDTGVAAVTADVAAGVSPIKSTLDGGIQSLVVSLLTMAFIITSIFTFIGITGLLVARFVVLVFLLATSPIGIAGAAVPILAEYATKWRKALFEQAFFAPAFVLLAGISFLILERSADFFRYNTVVSSSGWWSAQLMGAVVTFVLAIGFLQIATKTAKDLSEKTPDFKQVYDLAGKYVTKPLSGMTRWSGGFALRNTIGLAAERGLITYNKWAAGQRFDEGKLTLFGRQIPLPPGMVKGADRFAKKNLEKLQGAKFLGFEGYKPIKTEREAREISLGEELRAEENEGKLHGFLVLDDRKKYAALKAKKKAGTLSAEEQEKLQEYEDILEEDGAAHRLDHAIKKYDAELEKTRDRINPLTGKAFADTPDTTEWDTATSSFKTVTADERWQKHQDERNKERVYVKDAKTGNYRLENNEQYKARMDAGGEGGLGQKKGESLQLYQDRLESMSRRRPARAEVQSIIPTLPHDFYKEKYKERQGILVDLAHAWTPAVYTQIIDDPGIRRSIKDDITKKRFGSYFDLIEVHHGRVRDGLLLAGSDEEGEQLNVPYRETTKNFTDNEELYRAITSRPFEHIRRYGEFWNGGVRTGLFQAVTPRFSTQERRAVEDLKRVGYRNPMRRLNGTVILGGRAKWKDGTPVDTYELGYHPDSDNVDDIRDTLKQAEEDISVYGLFLKNIDEGITKASAKTIEVAENELAAAYMTRAHIQSKSSNKFWEDANLMRELNSGFNTDANIDKHIERALGGDYTNVGNVQKFIKEREKEAKHGLKKFVGGKAGGELEIVEMEDMYNRGLTGAMAPQEAATLYGNKDLRFKDKGRVNFFVENDMPTVASVAANPTLVANFGGWPNAEERQKINVQRRLEAARTGLITDSDLRDKVLADPEGAHAVGLTVPVGGEAWPIDIPPSAPEAEDLGRR